MGMGNNIRFGDLKWEEFGRTFQITNDTGGKKTHSSNLTRAVKIGRQPGTSSEVTDIISCFSVLSLVW